MNTIVHKSGISLDTILKSKEIYHTAFDVSTAPQAIISLDRRIMRTNRSFTRLTGYSEIDLMSLTLQDILIPGPESNDSLPRKEIEIGVGTQIEIDYICKNGAIRRGRFQFHLIKDRDTGPVCWIMVMEDLTAAREAEEAVHDYKQLFSRFIGGSVDGIIFLDTEGAILYMNKTARRMMNIASINDALKRKFKDYFVGLEQSAIELAVQFAAKGMGGTFQGSLAGKQEPVWLDVDITPIAGESKKVERLMVVSRDITAARKSEEALDALRVEMERREREAEERLARERERHAEEMRALREEAEKTEALLHEKETILREIHHRVKNNMQAIACLINLQSAQIDDRNVTEIFRNCIERIGSMSKVHEKLSTSENPSHIDFRDYILELGDELLNTHGKHGRITIASEIDEVFLGIKEAIPCGLLISEILSNAMKYAFPGDKTGIITIRLKRGGNGNYTLMIRDNGIGLPGGIDFENAATLGMELIRELTKQIKGSISAVSNGGVAYTVQFPADTVSGAA